MVKQTWQLVEQHGCWWAYEGELPPPEAFTTHGRAAGHILGPFPTRAMAAARGCGRAATAGTSKALRTAMRRHARLRWRRSPRAGGASEVVPGSSTSFHILV